MTNDKDHLNEFESQLVELKKEQHAARMIMSVIKFQLWCYLADSVYLFFDQSVTMHDIITRIRWYIALMPCVIFVSIIIIQIYVNLKSNQYRYE